jgi:hypothetical protein
MIMFRALDYWLIFTYILLCADADPPLMNNQHSGLAEIYLRVVMYRCYVLRRQY